MNHYTHFSEKERESIYFYLLAGKKKKEIALLLWRNPSSIWREITRNSSLIGMTRTIKAKLHYLPTKAHQKYIKRKQEVGKKWKVLKCYTIREEVVKYLRLGYSPPLISWILKKEKVGKVSHETIYQFIYHEDYRHLRLWENLPLRRHRRKKHNWRSVRKTKIPNRISITQRPIEVAMREVFGHWESDSIEWIRWWVCLHVSVERKTRKVRIRKLLKKNSEETNNAMKYIFWTLPKQAILTITPDNWTEFSWRERIKEGLWIDFYFTHPYSSREKWTVERINGFIRRFFPKKTDFATVTDEEIQFVEDWINNRPMEVLDFISPNQAFNHELSLIT
jgi:IS30 family transposase